MDPFLENPRLWPGFHDSLITYIRDELQEHLPEPYFAELEDRVYLTDPGQWVVREGLGSEGGAAAAPVLLHVPEEEAREPYLEIRDRRSGDRVVTAIELLSPDNKRKAGEGAELYRAKQRELLRAKVNLVEIDLLRAGEHVVAAPLDQMEPYRPYAYLVVVRRAARRDHREVYPVRLRDELPQVGIPLREPDPDVPLALQALLAKAYEGGAYWKRVDYAADADPPIAEEDRGWARERVGPTTRGS